MSSKPSMSVKLKLLRIQSGLTLEALARASSLTKSYVSKLERGASTPSVDAALRLAKALAVQVEEIFGEATEHEPVSISRARTRAPLGSGTPQVVSGTLPGHRLTAFVMQPALAPTHRRPKSHHEGEEILFVLKGKVAFEIDGRVEMLAAGDSVHFDSRIPHRIRSGSNVKATVLIIIA